MNRRAGLARLHDEDFDVLVIGGGATGLGCALDAAARGCRTALVEAEDFASGTSSRSTKLIHGGVRYLRQGNVALVREALSERTRLLQNAPQLVQPLAFVLPIYAWWELPYYAAGLRLYDALSAGSNLPRSGVIGRREVCELVPALETRAPKAGLLYWDACFDDARLAIALAQTAVDHGAALANYVRVQSFLYRDGRVCGVLALDREGTDAFQIRARAVINATGIFADEVRALDGGSSRPLLRFSRGTHIVVPRDAFDIADHALLVPRTADGRVVFALPWHGAVLIGTTDVPAARASIEPEPSQCEIDALLTSLNRFTGNALSARDVRSAFAGLRPLIDRSGLSTSRLSREHLILVERSGLITIAGGKWTTYRKMAQDAVEAARKAAQLSCEGCRTQDLRLRDVPPEPEPAHAVEAEMARTLADLLGRRKRTLFVDAASALTEARATAPLLARMLGRDKAWREAELRRFEALQKRYIPA